MMFIKKSKINFNNIEWCVNKIKILTFFCKKQKKLRNMLTQIM